MTIIKLNKKEVKTVTNSVIDFILNTDCGMVEKIHQSEEYKRLSDEGYEVFEKLQGSLGKEQIEMLEKFANLILLEEAEATDSYFKEGFKLGVRLATECLYR